LKWRKELTWVCDHQNACSRGFVILEFWFVPCCCCTCWRRNSAGSSGKGDWDTSLAAKMMRGLWREVKLERNMMDSATTQAMNTPEADWRRARDCTPSKIAEAENTQSTSKWLYDQGNFVGFEPVRMWRR
jgi:hypothetical protein